MTSIWTSRGLMDEALLTMTTGGHENDDEIQTWQEWRAPDGVVVKRDVHVHLKKPPMLLFEQGNING